MCSKKGKKVDTDSKNNEIIVKKENGRVNYSLLKKVDIW